MVWQHAGLRRCGAVTQTAKDGLYLQRVSKCGGHVVVVHAHDHTVDEDDGDDESIEPGMTDDLPGQLPVPLEIIPGHQVLPLQEHGSDKLKVEPQVGGHVGLRTVAC